jgi:hypothetical protein
MSDNQPGFDELQRFYNWWIIQEVLKTDAVGTGPANYEGIDTMKAIEVAMKEGEK